MVKTYPEVNFHKFYGKPILLKSLKKYDSKWLRSTNRRNRCFWTISILKILWMNIQEIFLVECIVSLSFIRFFIVTIPVLHSKLTEFHFKNVSFPFILLLESSNYHVTCTHNNITTLLLYKQFTIFHEVCDFCINSLFE